MKSEFAEVAVAAVFDTCTGKMKRFSVYSLVFVPWLALKPPDLFMAFEKSCDSPPPMPTFKKESLAHHPFCIYT